MHMLRDLRWPEDRQAILALDTSFTTEQVYRVVVESAGFSMRSEVVTPALHKIYNLAGEIEQFAGFDCTLVAESDTRLVGVAGLSHDRLDHRALVQHLYVDRAYRGQGIGRTLLEALVARARQWQVRCLWLETQDVNYSAIHFYQQNGFSWCGLDLSLDVRVGAPTDETAIFFMRSL